MEKKCRARNGLEEKSVRDRESRQKIVIIFKYK